MLISSTIADNALSTPDNTEILATTKNMLRISALDSTQDTFIMSYIQQAHAYLQGQTGLAFASTAVTEWYDEVRRDLEVKTLLAPIVSITKVGQYTNAEVADAIFQRVDGFRVLIDQNPENGVEVTYTAGLSTLPDDIKTGIARCAVCLFESDGKVLKNTLFHRRRTLAL